MISICIPIYNAEKYLKFAIESVLRQTYSNFELLLINDGSTDDSLRIMEYYAKKDNRVKVFNDGVNKGLIYRLNESVQLAKGKYYARMDADDIMFLDRIEKQIAILKGDESVDLVHSNAVSINALNEVIGFKPNTSEGTPIHPSVMGKRIFFLENQYENGFFQMEDMELWYRTQNKYNFYHIDEPLLFYREDNAKVSTKHKKMYKGLVYFCEVYQFSFFKRAKILTLSRLKYLSYKVFEMIGLDKFLISKRYQTLSQSSIHKYQNKLINSIGRI